MKRSLLSLITAAAFGVSAQANTVYTTPSGYITFDLNVGFNVEGLNVHNPALLSGTFDAESIDGGNTTVTLTDNEAAFSTTLNEAGATYLLEITSGTANGVVAEISTIGSTTLEIANSALIGGNGQTYNIRKAMTLRQIFGADDAPKLTAAGNSVAADIIWVPNGSGDYDRYFYRDAFGNTSLRNLDSPTATLESIPVFYPSGLLLEVKSTATAFQVFGEVKTTPSAFTSSTGFNIVTVASPAGQTLGDSGLDATLQAAANSVAADVVWVPNGSGGYTKYFLRSAFGNTNWRLVDDENGANQDLTPINGALLIERKGVDTSGVFQLPTNFAN